MAKVKVEAKGYGIVQRDFMTSDVSIYAKLVYTLLRTYSGDKDSCYPSINTIVTDLKISKSTVIRSIKELEESNMIVVRRSKKKGKNENAVNMYVPLSLMVEIDLEKRDSEGEEVGLGGTHQTPRGTHQTPGVVSEEYRKNNSIKNNKEESLNINTEASSVDNNLFPDYPKKEVGLPIEKKQTLHERMVHVWLKEFKTPWKKFSATDGRKIKDIKDSLIGTLNENGNEATDDTIVDLFRTLLFKMPERFKTKKLQVIEGDYHTIVSEIKKTNTYGQTTKQSGQRAGVTNFKFNVPDPREKPRQNTGV